MLVKHRPDLVVLNSSPPHHAGLELIQQIHARDAGVPVILTAANGRANAAIEAIARGAFDYMCKPLDFERMRALVAQALKTRQPPCMADGAPPAAAAEPPAVESLIGNCAAMQEVYKAIGRVAPKKVNVLILGESGTGKELVAQAIQRHSPRARRPASWPSIAPPFPSRSWKASCSATRRAPSPAPTASGWESSSNARAARSSSTKSAT